jgi:uncharacterized protein YfaA (DUF2138 family)
MELTDMRWLAGQMKLQLFVVVMHRNGLAVKLLCDVL